MEIDQCLAKYLDIGDGTKGKIEGIVYRVAGKRIVLNYDMEQPVEIGRVRMTANEALRHLNFADYVKAILIKSKKE